MSQQKTTSPSLKNQDWKKFNVETEKNKQSISTYLNRQHNRTEQVNLCGRKTSQ